MIRERDLGPSTARTSGRRTRVLIACDHYLPGVRAGGPIRSIAAIVAALGRELDLHVATRDRDLGAERPYAGVVPGRWMERDGARVLYWPAGAPGPATWESVLRAVAPDVLYLNSFFSPRFTVLPLLLRRSGRPVPPRFVLAPRGELHPGALAIRRWKKEPYLRLARRLGLLDGVVWHATAEEEKAQIRAWFGSAADVAVAPVLAPAGGEPAAARPHKRSGQLEVAFLSRISEKKNLLGAIGLLDRIAGSVRLNVYGPKEDAAYWERCRRASATLPPSVRLCDHGEVAPEDVGRVLAQNHVLFLPTQGENFGHVILESLVAGTPVLISDQTPWRDLERRGAGWDLPLAEPERFRARLQSLVAMDASELEAWSHGARHLGRAYAGDPELVRRSRALLGAAEGA